MWGQRNNRSVALFRQMPLFAGCRDKDLALIGRFADEVILPAGTRLVAEGVDRAADCFLVLSGCISIERDGREVHVLGKGALVGAEELLSGGPRAFSARSTTPARVFSFSRAGFRQLMRCPPVAARIAAICDGRLQATAER